MNQFPTLDKLPNNLTAFLPHTLEERKAKLKERMSQQWPTFYRSGYHDFNKLWIGDHVPGTVVVFFKSKDSLITFDKYGVVKHGAFWYLSEPMDGHERLSNQQMQDYLVDAKLNWIVLL